ncbi:MAG: hypothetical protein M3463_19140 [Verrucomicrobiota bacterium]|nr:hypothetical protein [Verrucomicrobiota bacterium]
MPATLASPRLRPLEPEGFDPAGLDGPALLIVDGGKVRERLVDLLRRL